MIPYREKRKKEKVIPKLIKDIEKYKEYILESEESLKFRKQLIKALKDEIKQEEYEIYIYECAIMQCEMSILKLQEEDGNKT